MKGTLFSADFVKDSSENLRLLELNTDTAFLTDALSDLDLSGWISVMSDNNITSVDIIYKPVIHRNIHCTLTARIIVWVLGLRHQTEN